VDCTQDGHPVDGGRRQKPVKIEKRQKRGAFYMSNWGGKHGGPRTILTRAEADSVGHVSIVSQRRVLLEMVGERRKQRLGRKSGNG